MKAKYLLDTVILIDHLNGFDAATEWLSRLTPGEAAISVITRAEVLVGTQPEELERVEGLLGQYRCFSPGPAVADRAAQMRRKNSWKLPDAFQAAVSEEQNLKLVTRNTRDFPPDRFDFVLVPYDFESADTDAEE